MQRSITRLLSLTALAVFAACSGEEAADKSVAVSKVASMPAAASISKSGGPSDAVRFASSSTMRAGLVERSKDIEAIEIGRSVSAAIERDDIELDDGTFADAWVLSVPQKQNVRIIMESSEVDSYLWFYESDGNDGLGELLARDDDSAGFPNAGVEGVLNAGVYVILASTFATEYGSYSLRVEGEGGSSPAGGNGTAGMLQSGGSASGQLTSSHPALGDDTHYAMHTFRADAGDQVTVTMTSDDFDTYLLMAMGGGALESLEMLAENDDGPNMGVNSQITYQAPESGVYTIVANSYAAGATGSYTLALSIGAANWAQEIPTGGDPAGKYAVLVGIDDYPGTGSDLSGPVDDARLVGEVLQSEYGFRSENILMLTDAQATRPGIANAIVRHLGQAGEDGVAVFFYSGHGTRLGENIGLRGPLDPEADGQDDGIYIYGSNSESSIILDEEIGYLLAQLDAGRILMAIDACFSGTISRAAGVQAKRTELNEIDADFRMPKTFISDDLGADFGFGSGVEGLAAALSNPDRHILMASSSEEQVSWTVGGFSSPRSLFTHYFTEALREADGRTTWNDLLRMVDGPVDDYIQSGGGRMSDQDTQLSGPGTNRSVRDFLGGN